MVDDVSNTEPSRSIAAVDLGSNSFHLVVAREEGEQVRVLDRDRIRVALAAGLRRDGTLAPEVIEIALGTLQRFGQRLRAIPDERVRAVGTQTFRRLNDGGAFHDAAEQALGHSIDLLSGVEEARLIYLGLSHERTHEHGRTLVIDIGGGSTECIIGEGPDPIMVASLPMGCVTYQQRFFKKGLCGRNRFDRAVLAAEAELEGMKRRFLYVGWTIAIGTSGTARAISEILAAKGGDGRITLPRLEQLRKEVIEARRADALVGLPGMPTDRAPVLASGLAIMIAVFRSLKIEAMNISGVALREGVLYDLLGRSHADDARERTVAALMARYHVDLDQAARVRASAGALLESVKESWGLAGPRAARFLDHAARLHEIGLSVAYSGHQKHGGYLIANGELPGFSAEEQALLATLVRHHRRKITTDFRQEVPPRDRAFALRVVCLLRIAVLINRSRNPNTPALPVAIAEGDSIALAFPPGYLDDHVMTRLDLKDERAAIGKLGIRLRFA